jgi:hypothetical protein
MVYMKILNYVGDMEQIVMVIQYAVRPILTIVMSLN